MFIVTINNKNEKIDRGKCLGWPGTSYVPVRGVGMFGFTDQEN